MKIYRIFTVDDPYCGDITHGLVQTDDIKGLMDTLNKDRASYDAFDYEEMNVISPDEFIKRFGHY